MSSFNSCKHLFTPLQIGNTALKNRVEFAPVACGLVNSLGEPLQSYLDFVEKQAESGAALIHLGAAPVDFYAPADGRNRLDVTNSRKYAGLSLLAEAAHRHGAKISVPLFHPAPNSPRTANAEIISRFNDCTAGLKQCGFDGVMLCCSDYISDVEFALKLLKTVRKTAGLGFFVEMRISISGDELGGAIDFLKLAQEYIDLVNVSSGSAITREFQAVPPYFAAKAGSAGISRAIKECPDITIPVSLSGGIDSAGMAERILKVGSADMIALARPLLCDLEMLQKARRGTPGSVRPCLRCMNCTDRPVVTCAVNPALTQKETPVRRESKKKAVIIGGGPAGAHAAITLSARGHKVVLFEKNSRLGGRLLYTGTFPFRDDLRRYTEWLSGQVLSCRADIFLNTEATPELVMEQNPDAIIIAAGSVPNPPPIRGIENAVNVLNALEQTSKGRAIICGGGLSGCEAAVALAARGMRVTIVDMLQETDLAGGADSVTHDIYFQLFAEYKIKIVSEHIIRGIGGGAVELEDKNWQYKTLRGDYIVEALGMSPDLRTRGKFSKLIPDVYFIGDCCEARDIMYAVKSGSFLNIEN